MFLAPPWVRWRELPSKLREQTARLALHEHVLLFAQAHVPDETRVVGLLPYQSVTGERPLASSEEGLFARSGLAAVVTHRLVPDHGGHPAIQAVTVVVVANSAPSVSRFFRIPDDANDEATLADVERLLARDGRRNTLWLRPAGAAAP